MLQKLVWLVYGPHSAGSDLSAAQLMSRMLAVSRVRTQKNAPSPEDLLEGLEGDLIASRCPDVLINVFKTTIETLEEMDDSVSYFVLYLTGILKVDYLAESLACRAYEQGLVAGRRSGQYEAIPNASLTFLEDMPWLPWDLMPALEEEVVLQEEKENHNFDYIGEPLTASGQLTKEFTEALRSQRLRFARQMRNAMGSTRELHDDEVLVVTYEFQRSAMLQGVAAMYQGISSDLFQPEGENSFSLQKNAEVRDDRIHWQMIETSTYLTPHIEKANLIRKMIREFFSVSHRDARKVIMDSCRKQLDVFYAILDRLARHQREPMLLILNQMMDVGDYIQTVLSVCSHLLDSELPEVELAIQLNQIQSMALEMSTAALRHIRNDVYRYITISVSVYISRNRLMQEMEESDFIEKLFGPLDTTKENEYTSMARACRIFRSIQANVNISHSFDLLYKNAVEDLTFSCDLEEITNDADKLGLRKMLLRVLRPLESRSLLDPLVEDFRGFMHLISSVFLPIRCRKLPHAREINEHKLHSLNIPRRHIMCLQWVDDTLSYEAPPPLSMIINQKHTTRYQYIREQFMLLCEANHALLQIDLRGNMFLPGEDRIAFFRRTKMMSIVGTLVNHVATVVRNVWRQLQEDLDSATCFHDVINAQRRAMRQLIQRTLLETRNRATVRIITNISDFCSRFAGAFISGDARSCDIHYDGFYDQIRVLCERLATETDNTYAKVLLVQLDCWGYLEEIGNKSRINNTATTTTDTISFVSTASM